MAGWSKDPGRRGDRHDNRGADCFEDVHIKEPLAFLNVRFGARQPISTAGGSIENLSVIG